MKAREYRHGKLTEKQCKKKRRNMDMLVERRLILLFGRGEGSHGKGGAN
jgi:hypothetical protein